MNALRNFFECLSMLLDFIRGTPAEWADTEPVSSNEPVEPPVFGFTRLQVVVGAATVALAAFGSSFWKLGFGI